MGRKEGRKEGREERRKTRKYASICISIDEDVSTCQMMK